ncbi:hypothetical protein [Echinicola salinicaeni]|uniref:hypothetical protein n=1 Tax=Echinicola salinicaeni TaxID=2762757 RepID=UPI0016496347|nr:hypothetical protein [Echinicola salinicaeni]
MNCRTVELSNLPCGSQDGELVDWEWLRVNGKLFEVGALQMPFYMSSKLQIWNSII